MNALQLHWSHDRCTTTAVAETAAGAGATTAAGPGAGRDADAGASGGGSSGGVRIVEEDGAGATGALVGKTGTTALAVLVSPDTAATSMGAAATVALAAFAVAATTTSSSSDDSRCELGVFFNTGGPAPPSGGKTIILKGFGEIDGTLSSAKWKLPQLDRLDAEGVTAAVGAGSGE